MRVKGHPSNSAMSGWSDVWKWVQTNVLRSPTVPANYPVQYPTTTTTYPAQTTIGGIDSTTLLLLGGAALLLFAMKR